ncbi:hypothetical protein ACHAXT_002080 [Thalassiosira profunda]
MVMAPPPEVGLAAYTDRLSGRPGDVIRFYASSTSAGSDGHCNIKTRMTRCICADPNPAGPGMIEEDASPWFEPREFAGRRQEICSGSYGRSRDVVEVPEGAAVTVEVWVCPTHIIRGDGREGEEGKAAELQCVWSWGGLGLYLHTNGGHISVLHKGSDVFRMSPSARLSPNKWHRCTVTVDAAGGACKLNVVRLERLSQKEVPVVDCKCCVDCSSYIPSDAHVELASGGKFNGRLEDPRISIGAEGDEQTLIRWDTAQHMSEWTIPSADDSTIQGNPLILHNHPTRAVRGRRWDGTEMDWRHKPSHYGGIHFHDDDLFDAGWECDLDWEIPLGMPSGIYVVRLTDDAGEEEALPLFICSLLGGERKKLCVLISTFTYVMYGNHARADYTARWMTRAEEWMAYPRNPSNYPNYGRSTYNFHTDGSGICFASHLRPLFNLRPGYFSFGDSACSGLRHFPADTHLIAFLHHHNIEYDVVTDHELHKDGVAAIAGYQTLVTGTHPEYHTENSLNAIQQFRDDCSGNIMYLGGNGFYWRIEAEDDEASFLEIRRAEDGVRTWASEPGEYFHMLGGGSYGGLWRRNDRPPQRLVGVGFAAQGSFEGMPYRRVCYDEEMDWLFEGVESELLGDFGFSGNGAAGFELDRVDRRLDGEDYDITILAQAFDEDNKFMLPPEEVLTTYSILSGTSADRARRSDMVYFRMASGAQVFSAGSITFCGSLPWNDYANNIATIVGNVIEQFSGDNE